MLVKIQYTIESLKKRGLKRTSLIALSYLIDRYFDVKYKTDTCSWVGLDELAVDHRKKKHAFSYQQTHAVPLRKLLRKLKIPPGKVLVDLGCGKGRVPLVASEFGFKETRGIELCPNLCDVAIKNFAIYREKTQTNTNFVIVNKDVIDYEIKDDEEIFFLFNPFDNHVLEKFLQNVKDSLHRRNRGIWIIYRNARYRETIETTMNVTKVMEFISWGQDFVVFNVKQDAELIQVQQNIEIKRPRNISGKNAIAIVAVWRVIEMLRVTEMLSVI